MSKKEAPKPGKFYYVDYQDKQDPDGSYFGIAECVHVYEYNRDGEPLIPPLYEFKHPDKTGKMVLSVFYADEVILGL
jgi:hypothetical protein